MAFRRASFLLYFSVSLYLYYIKTGYPRKGVTYLSSVQVSVLLLTFPRRCFFCGSVFLFIVHICFCYAVLSVPCSLVVNSLEKADLLTLLYFCLFQRELSIINFTLNYPPIRNIQTSASLLSMLIETDYLNYPPIRINLTSATHRTTDCFDYRLLTMMTDTGFYIPWRVGYNFRLAKLL